MREWIVGRNPVLEVVRAKRRHVFRCLLAEGIQRSGKIQEIEELCRQRKIPLETVPRTRLDQLDEYHQGVVIEVNDYAYADLASILARGKQRGEPALVLVLDMIQNPQNLGTLIRSAEALGVHGIVLPLARTAGVTPAVVHSSAGATEYQLIAQANLAQALAQMKQKGVWIFGLDAGPQSLAIEKMDLTLPLAWVVGNEGDGIRPLVRKQCDQIVSLSMSGKIDSFNAATAGSIALYLSQMQRQTKLKG